ncbi:MAG: hypothetical protein EBU90_30665, partial [Proteobacteria bacterium]|nr:hypothetical protein [Pseudomonadota bacterium]
NSMKIVVVGNGRCALTRENGQFIDNCDVVVRIKDFSTKGYEKYVGSKIDIFSSKWFSWFDRSTGYPLTLDFLNQVQQYMFMFFDPKQTYEISNEYVKLYSTLQLKNDFAKDGIGTPVLHDELLHKFGVSSKPLIYMTPLDIQDLMFNKLRVESNNFLYNKVKLIEPTCGIRTLYKVITMYEDHEIYITGYDGFLTSRYWDPSHSINIISHFYLNELVYLRKLIKTNRVINLDER